MNAMEEERIYKTQKQGPFIICIKLGSQVPHDISYCVGLPAIGTSGFSASLLYCSVKFHAAQHGSLYGIMVNYFKGYYSPL